MKPANQQLKEKWSIKEKDRTCCNRCGHAISRKWNYCIICGAENQAKYPDASNSDTDPQSGQ